MFDHETPAAFITLPCVRISTLSLSLTVSSFRKLHQAAVIVWNHHPAPCEWLRRIIPPQIALQTETEKFKWSPVGLAGSLQDWCIRGTLSSQSDRTLRLHRPLLHSDTLGSGAEQRHGLALPWHERYAPLLFPRTRQRQARVPCRLQPVHWPCEYRYFLKGLKNFFRRFNQAMLTGLHTFSHFNGFHPMHVPPSPAAWV